MKQSNSKSCGWDKPVSRKYYNELTERVVEIASAVSRQEKTRLTTEVLSYVDAYLENPRGGFTHTVHFKMESDIIFMTLRADIDRAIRRSKQAKARAAIRRHARLKAARETAREAAREASKSLPVKEETQSASTKEDTTPSTPSSSKKRTLLPSRNKHKGQLSRIKHITKKKLKDKRDITLRKKYK